MKQEVRNSKYNIRLSIVDYLFYSHSRLFANYANSK